MGSNSPTLDDTTSDTGGFQSFENAAADAVLAANFNSAGTRIATCSADHRIRVYDIDETDEWTLIEQRRGHNAEIIDVQWVDSRFGQMFATIGSDNKFKLWREDQSQAPRSGRRFHCIWSQTPPNSVPYVSFEFKALKHEIWLALITQDGLLSLLEPSDYTSLASWIQLDALYPFGPQRRGADTRFRLSFHHGEAPSTNAIAAGLDRKALSLAVSANLSLSRPDETQGFIKICRTFKSDEGNYRFQNMLEIPTGKAVINDMAWAPGCMRPFDTIAIACDDGTVRCFEITTPSAPPGVLTNRVSPAGKIPSHLSDIPRNPPSGISAGLAGISRIAAPRDAANTINIKHEWREAAHLAHGDGNTVWRVRWIYDGSALASTGDNGKLHIWRQNVDEQYIEFSETGT